MIISNNDLIKRLKLHIKSSILREEPIDNILLYGLPGLGKTTIARWISLESRREMITINAANVRNISDIVTVLKQLNSNSILFIDEIHRLKKRFEEILYSAIDDNLLTIFIGEGDFSNKIELPINKFTLIGATTELENISEPLKSRFPILEGLSKYSEDAIKKIIIFNLEKYGIIVNDSFIKSISKYSRGNPRSAVNCSKIIRDMKYNNLELTVNNFLGLIKMNTDGLTVLEQKYIDILKQKYNGGPVSARVLSIAIGVNKETLVSDIEPFLIEKGMIMISSKGRTLI